MRFEDKNIVVGLITPSFIEITDYFNIELGYSTIKIEPYIYSVEDLVFDDFIKSGRYSSDIRGLWLLNKKVVGILVNTIMDFQ